MPYKIKGKCIYKKSSGKKVGCTEGSVKKYMAALHANVKESLNECWELKNAIITDGGHEATVFFDLTKAPGVQIGLVYDLSNPEMPPDYVHGVIRDSNTKQMQSFEDPNDAASLLKKYGVKPQDVENEMYQQGVEQIESEQSAASKDDGVRESLEFEALFDEIINS